MTTPGSSVPYVERDVIVPSVRGRSRSAYGVRTHYAEAGEGSPLILIHGGGPGASGVSGWRKVLPRLAESWHVYALDLIGAGLSDKPPIDYDLLTLVDHVAGFIETLGLGPVLACGNSQGAYVALRYTMDYPDRVRAAGLVSSGTIATACGVVDSARPSYPKWDGTRDALRRFMEFILNDHSNITDELLDRRMESVSSPGHDEAYQSLQQWRQLIAKGDGNARQLYDMTERLRLLATPVTFIWAADDKTAPIETIGKGMQDKYPDISFHVVADSGHQVQTDQPDRLCDILEAFFPAS